MSEKKQEPTDEPSPIDVHVGQRVRLRRTLLGLSQNQLGKAVGLTFQQIQKYESGMNRISASRLFDFARLLRVPIAYFFEDAGAASIAAHVAVASPSDGRDPAMRRETLELVRAYYRIDNPQTRRSIKELLDAMANGAAPKG